MPLKLTRFTDDCIDGASALVAQKYDILRSTVPELPLGCSDQAEISREIGSGFKRGSGVAAFHGDTMIGFLITGYQIASFHGRRAIYIPEWAHGASDVSDISRIYQVMYSEMSAKWADDGFYSHVVSLFPYEKSITKVLFRFGFGMIVIDALRDLVIVEDPQIDKSIYVRLADETDIEGICRLDCQLQRHLTAPPTFLASNERSSKEDELKWLSKPDHKIMLAVKDTVPIGFIRANPPDPHSGFIARQEKTLCITGAYVLPEYRRSGAAYLTLQAVLRWAAASGYERCRVDFESANVLGSEFWLRHFRPVLYSLVRHADANCSQPNIGTKCEGNPS